MNRISLQDLFGIHYIRKSNHSGRDSYYSTIDELRPLFRDENFLECVTGFYLNIYGENNDSVRLSYFIKQDKVKDSLEVFNEYFSSKGFMGARESDEPIQNSVAKKYGGKSFEEQFRNFLNYYTKIGLDILEIDVNHARTLAVTYRWQVRKASLSVRNHFEPTFEKCSIFYNTLSDSAKTQFFSDLDRRPNQSCVDWAHMMVNFLLGGDWNDVFNDPTYLTPGEPLGISEMNLKIKESNLGFEIPNGWTPVSL